MRVQEPQSEQVVLWVQAAAAQVSGQAAQDCGKLVYSLNCLESCVKKSVKFVSSRISNGMIRDGVISEILQL